jgi:hypothetical protein
MHFRVRKNVIQFIRTNYDPATKKPKVVVVGRVALNNPVIPHNLREALSAEELIEAENWIKYQHHITALREELAALTLAENLSLANNWFSRQGESEAASLAMANLLPELQALRKTLKNINLVD